MALLQGSLHDLIITDLSPLGEGRGFLNQRAIHVANTVPGDRVTVRLGFAARDYTEGILTRLDTPSPERGRPHCIVADRCGGCQWQHIEYAAQLRWKEQRVRESLLGIPGVSPAQEIGILGARDPYHYRNKAIYPIQQKGAGQPFRLGFYERGTHRLINLNQCPVQDPRLDVILQAIKVDLPATGWSAYDETSHQGDLRSLSLRVGRHTGECLITLVSRRADLPDLPLWAERWLHLPGVVGVCLNEHRDPGNRIWGSITHPVVGQTQIQEQFGGLTFWIDSTSFFQVYTEQAECFFTWILDQLPLSTIHTAIDAYCGMGTLTLLLAYRAPHLQRLIGIESLPSAIVQAQANAAANQITGVEWQCTTVATGLATSLATEPAIDLVIVDPPRKGCEAEVLTTLLTHRPRWIIYISCHLPTLVRDLGQLTSAYDILLWRAADFFPQTIHVETVVILTLKES